jgi:hypothetical protein
MRTLTIPVATALLLGLAPVTAQASDPDPAQILAASDRARGGGLPGVVWNLKLTSSDPESEDLRQLTIRALDGNSLATTTYPPRLNGAKLLQVERNMWYGRPDLRKPISISARQKMTGQAANGDIAATNYYADYLPKLLRAEKVGDEEAYVLELTGKNQYVTYDRIIYWVSKKRLVALKAEFYTVSGKLIKDATFEYNNVITYKDQKVPFVSKMTIHDAINKANLSTLEYYQISVRALNPADFNINVMSE